MTAFARPLNSQTEGRTRPGGGWWFQTGRGKSATPRLLSLVGFVMIVAPTLSRQYCHRGRLIARQTDCIEFE